MTQNLILQTKKRPRSVKSVKTLGFYYKLRVGEQSSGIYVPVKATDTEINEKSAAAFVEYGRQFGKVFAQAGLRYEHLKNDYFNFGQRERLL